MGPPTPNHLLPDMEPDSIIMDEWLASLPKRFRRLAIDFPLGSSFAEPNKSTPTLYIVGYATKKDGIAPFFDVDAVVVLVTTYNPAEDDVAACKHSRPMNPDTLRQRFSRR